MELIKVNNNVNVVIEELRPIYQDVANCIGTDSLLKLCRHYGNESLYIPLLKELSRNKTNKDILRYYKEGKTIREICAITGVSSATVYRRIRERLNK